MRQTVLSTALAVFFGTGLFAADPQLMNLVMPDAQVMAGVNVTTSKTSPLGQFLLSQIAAQGGDHFEQLTSLTGFDPRRDLVEVLAAMPGNAGGKKGALVLARGTFNVSLLSDALVKAGDGAQVTSYGGATLLTGKAGKNEAAVAFLGTSIAIAGDADSVKAAVDRSAGKNSVSAAMANKVAALSTSQDVWAVSLEPISALAPKADSATAGPAAQAAQFLQSIQAANGGVKFGSLIVLTAQAVASDAKNAGALADVVRMLSSLVALGGQQNSQAAKILQSLQVSTDGNSVNVSLSLAESDAEQLLKMGSQADARRGN